MHYLWPSLATATLTVIGAGFAAPVLIRGFGRRGKGVKYEQNFKIQRAPQLSTLATVVFIVVGFLMQMHIIKTNAVLTAFFTLSRALPLTLGLMLSWLGVAIMLSGFVFMIGGWYSLGECFSTDAEVLDGHHIRKTGLLQFVMHPAYSGIIQSLLGSALACLSPIAVFLTLAVVAPLWLQRAVYEEKLMIETFGQEYKDYGNQLGWRRLVPIFLPIGV